MLVALAPVLSVQLINNVFSVKLASCCIRGIVLLDVLMEPIPFNFNVMIAYKTVQRA